jgi:hypothetical protein
MAEGVHGGAHSAARIRLTRGREKFSPRL